MTLSRRARLVAVLVVAAGIRLANLYALAELPIVVHQREWVESDMETSWRWSGHILAGDLLSREPTYAYTYWMRTIAPVETWERWWGGRGVFFRAPLYAYALAGFRLATGDGYWGVALCQLALGVAGVGLVFLLAERFFGPLAAMAAGLGSALYGPSLLYEAFLLRDALTATAALSMLWTLVRAPDGGVHRWLLAGLCFALNALARETTVAFAPFVVLWAVQRLGARAAARALGGFAVGAALGLASLAARNVAIGVVPWALSSRGVEELVLGHASGGSLGGLGIPPATRSILEQSDARLLPAVRLTLASYGGDWRALAAHELARLGSVASRFEAGDNVNWYYFEARSGALRWSLGFEVVLALGLVGLCVPRRQGDDRIVRYFLLTCLVGLLYASVIGRYRLVPATVLWVYAGAMVAWIADAVARARWRAALVPSMAVAALLVVSATLARDLERRERWRAAEFVLATRHYIQGRQLDRALDEVREGLRTAYRGPDQRALPPAYWQLVKGLVTLNHHLGRHAVAAAELEELAADYPDDAYLQGSLGALYQILGQREHAEKHFARQQALGGR
jgi:4-amino-4-deoxy-L-arabinose transferase-like glycosyltransferase